MVRSDPPTQTTIRRLWSDHSHELNYARDASRGMISTKKKKKETDSDRPEKYMEIEIKKKVTMSLRAAKAYGHCS